MRDAGGTLPALTLAGDRTREGGGHEAKLAHHGHVLMENREGYTNFGSRRGLIVLVQQSAEEIPATYVSGQRASHRR
jgi:hypothetical protein